MNYFFLMLFGLAPSIIWLLFYLRQDVHPESNQQIIKVFLYGMLIAIPTALVEVGLSRGFLAMEKVLNLSSVLVLILYIFLGVALVEEFFKYLVFKLRVEKSPELDEPVDIILYMIIAGLGFAALENLLIFWPPGQLEVFESLIVSILRLVGATFLHALCSGTLGYFLVLSFLERKKRKRFFFSGLAIVAFLHGLYNFSILKPGLLYRPLGIMMKVEDRGRFIVPVIILIGLAFFVFWGISKVKKMKSICKVYEQ